MSSLRSRNASLNFVDSWKESAILTGLHNNLVANLSFKRIILMNFKRTKLPSGSRILRMSIDSASSEIAVALVQTYCQIGIPVTNFLKPGLSSSSIATVTIGVKGGS